MSVKAKLLIAAIMLAIYGVSATVVQRVYFPAIVNPTAMRQFEDSAESYTALQTLQLVWSLWGWGWIAIVVIIFAMFYKDIKNLVEAFGSLEETER